VRRLARSAPADDPDLALADVVQTDPAVAPRAPDRVRCGLRPALGLLGNRWSAEIKRVGAKRLTAEHTERVRTLAALLAVQLPVHGVPRASACLAGACERVRRQQSYAGEVAVASLAVYVPHFHAIPRSVN
jgi:hypothetical protein